MDHISYIVCTTYNTLSDILHIYNTLSAQCNDPRLNYENGMTLYLKCIILNLFEIFVKHVKNISVVKGHGLPLVSLQLNTLWFEFLRKGDHQQEVSAGQGLWGESTVLCLTFV